MKKEKTEVNLDVKPSIVESLLNCSSLIHKPKFLHGIKIII